MEIQVNNTGDLDCIVKVTIPKSAVDEQFNTFLADIKDTVQVKGFRKGQAPIEVIKNTLGDAVKAEVSARLTHSGTVEAINERKLYIAGNPMLVEEDRATDKKKYVGTYHLDGSFSFAIECQLIPELDPVDYIDVPVAHSRLATVEGWVEGQLDEAQRKYADRNPIDRPIEKDDEVLVDFEGTIEGEVFEGGSSQGHLFVIGHGGFIEGFEEGFVGKKVGDTFDVQCAFPTNYHAKELIGKEVNFHCNVITANELTPCPLDDTLAQIMSYATIEDLRNHLAEQASSMIAPVRAAVLTELMDDILEKNKFPLPSAWHKNEMEVTAQRLGLTELPSDVDEREELETIAERVVRQSFLLDKIYEKETDIHFTADDVQALLAQEGKRAGQSADEYLSSLKRTNKYNGFMSYHEQQRTIDFLIEKSVVKEN